MAERIVLLMNQDVTPDQIQEPQVGDTYLMPVDVNITAALTVTGLINGRNVAADGALAGTALQPTDNLSELTNNIIASQGEAEAGSDNTKMMTPLRVAQAIATLGAGLKHNYTATVDPTPTDDENSGYSVGSMWVNTVADEAYKCVDAAANVAVWVRTTVSANDLAAVALSGNSDDLTEGSTNLLMTQAERDALTNLSSTETGIVAYAGGGQTNGTLLTARYNIVETCATAGDSVKLPAANSSAIVVVKNTGVANLAVFPAAGEQIDKESANDSVTINTDTVTWFYPISSTKWETL